MSEGGEQNVTGFDIAYVSLMPWAGLLTSARMLKEWALQP